MDWVRAWDSPAPALCSPRTSPADGDRSISVTGDPFLSAMTNKGGGADADLSCQPDVSDISQLPDEAAYSSANRGLITPPATLRGANPCCYGLDCNPGAPADDSDRIIVVPGWKKSLDKFNWGRYIVEVLCAAAAKMKQDMRKKNAVSNITGCLLFLQVFYLDSINLGEISMQHDVFPRITVFTADKIRAMINADKRQMDSMKNGDFIFGISSVSVHPDQCMLIFDTAY